MPEGHSSSRPATALFLGTPPFAVPSLEALAAFPPIDIVGVFTQPDRPSGRGMKRIPSPVKQTALALDLPVYQPENLKEQTMEPILTALPSIDFIFVVAYAKKIPNRLLEYPKYGCINLHPSLLPKYRGGAPLRQAMIAGEKVSGVSTMYVVEEWDAGDVIFQEEIPSH